MNCFPALILITSKQEYWCDLAHTHILTVFNSDKNKNTHGEAYHTRDAGIFLMPQVTTKYRQCRVGTVSLRLLRIHFTLGRP